MAEQKLLLFRKWDTTEIEIKDLGLQTAVSLKTNSLPSRLWSFSTKEIQ